MISSVKLKNIRRHYNSAGFSLSIDDIEFHNHKIHVLVGPNGSGKTSILRLIALLDEPNEGKIFFNERDVFFNNGTSGLRKSIGFLMQTPYLFNMDVSENVALGLKIRRYPKNEIIHRVENMLEALNIQHLAKRNVKNLSRGEYQKVAIAQVFVLGSDIILMDEPAANIDRESILSIEETLKDIQKEINAVIIMTTHSLTQAYRISPEIISIREGRIVYNVGI